MYEKLNEAIIFATNCHKGQVRKLSKTPYIMHPLEVATIISSITNDEDVIIAGLLHDTLEDSNADPALISERFGEKVLDLVKSETENKITDRPKADTWKERKESSLLVLKDTKDLNVKILWLGDKLSNMRSFYREFKKEGVKMWEHLNQKDPSMHKWYYEEIASLLYDLNETSAYQEYVSLMNTIFQNTK